MEADFTREGGVLFELGPPSPQAWSIHGLEFGLDREGDDDPVVGQGVPAVAPAGWGNAPGGWQSRIGGVRAGASRRPAW